MLTAMEVNRRSFILAFGQAAAAIALIGPGVWAAPKFKLSAMLGITFAPLKLPLLEQIERVAEAGYPAFEFIDWWNHDLDAVRAKSQRLGLAVSAIVGNRGPAAPGVSLVNPAERAAFIDEIERSLSAARRVGAAGLIVLTGNELPGVSRKLQRESIVEGLKMAARIAEPLGVTLLLEPLNTRVDHKGYYLYSAREALEIVREVASPSVKVLFDIYHVQIMEGNLIETIRSNIAWIGHFHVADVPGRFEPGTGEINYHNVFRAIREAGYSGYVAMEFRPTGDPVRTLKEIKGIYNAIK